MVFSDGKNLEVIKEFKLLGVVLEDNLKWSKNTQYICQKARSKIWLLRNMKQSGLTVSELIDAYKKEVRSLLELAIPVWHSSLTKKQSKIIENVQKAALASILGAKYTNYENALQYTKLEALFQRRLKIC